MTGIIVVRVRSTLSIGRLGECAIGEYAILMNTMMVELLGQRMLPRLTERVLPSASGKMIDPAFVRSFISDVGLYDIGL